MKKIILALLPISLLAQSPAGYWQQEVHYEMDIVMDVDKYQFDGTQKLTYTNNSPDTLKQVFYHLYFNAFQPNSMMDERQRALPDPDKRIGDKLLTRKKKEIGFHEIKSLAQNGVEVGFKITETILQVQLVQPILPGETTVFDMSFHSQVPLQTRRSGRDNAEGIDFTMTQWYPKMAQYDKHGWHADPYVAREYYGVFGTFDVNISIDYQYKLGGTGVELTKEANWEVTGEKDGVRTLELLKTKRGNRDWKFHAENVHDFAWAADKEYVHTQFDGPDGLELNFFYLKEYDSTWARLPKYTAQIFDFMNKQFGKYAYPQFSVIQGGDGGMEYPMCTMLKGTGKMPGLVGVTAHEGIHNWYYGILGINEVQYPWMDEGFTSFAEEEVLHKMKGLTGNAHKGANRNYQYLVTKDMVEPMSTPGDYFSTNMSYGISSYSRGALFLSQLRYILGEDDFNEGMLRFYNIWKFKHPDPYDFVKVMEDVSGIQLDWYLNFWVNTTKTIDYGVKELRGQDRGSLAIDLEKVGEMPMPIRLSVKMKNGDTWVYYIPLVSMMGAPNEESIQRVAKPWPWTNPNYTLSTELMYKDVESVTIDVDGETADINTENNSMGID